MKRLANDAIRICLAAALVLAPFSRARSQTVALSGHWQGTMERDGAVMTVRFDFQEGPSGITGRFTSDTQRAMEYPLNRVEYSAPAVYWVLGGSLIFDGVVARQAITGTFQDGPGRGTFALKPVSLAPPPYERQDVTFQNGDVVLSGTLLRPRGGGLHPGIVFLHGSGPETRWGTPLFFADRFARGGVAALVFDKRGSGQSTGDWKTVAFQELAGDYLAAIRFLKAQSGVNPKKVGIMGHSQGATISPLLASQPGVVAFVIAAAATGTGPLFTQDLYRTRNDLEDLGLTEDQIFQAMALYTRWIDVARTGEGWDDLEQAMAAARAETKNEKWLRFLGLPQKKDNWLYKWYPPVGNFNPLPLWEKVKVPVLLVYGELDRNTPVTSSLSGIGQALRKAGNDDFTPIILPGVVHNLTIQPRKDEPFVWWYGAPGYPELVIAWVRSRFSSAPQ